MGYRETEIKMPDVGEAMLVFERKAMFAVPIKVARYSEYLAKRGKKDFGLPESKNIAELDLRLRQSRRQERFSL